MRKLAGLALIAVMSIATFATQADAMNLGGRGAPSTPSSNGNGDPVCIVACAPPTFTANTPKPTCHVGPTGPVTLAPAEAMATEVRPEALVIHRNPCSGASSDIQACGQKLGNLHRVTIGQVRRIGDNDKVHLIPICDTVHRSLTDQEMSFLAQGNVQGLIKPIGQNDTLEAALDDGGYRADNVIGIVLNPQAVTLYVSRAHQ